MNSFKELEKDSPQVPLGIKSNVQNQLGNMRTMGDILEMYISRILDIFTALLGGETNNKANTHLITLFVPSTKADFKEDTFLENLKTSFHLSAIPTILANIPANNGIEVSMKMPSRDAAQLTNNKNKFLLEEFRLELR